ncbi:unnamed protein product [Blepharisma stoltei]|uniref:Peptidase C19 ubiquitin carboxyl-terminal hydrolase domain-containing protein n=1 Tax=Blepharisma stoltei TaxID=1481888 RepID=A0AAU9IFU4_9CILI|nr:unnamed protein product [Blepharisma stoltei]
MQDNQNLQSQIKFIIEKIEPIRPPPVINYPLIFDKKKSDPNIGNTCYLNSLLQVLASNNEFYEKIQTLEYGLFSTLSSLLLSIRNPRSNDTQKLVSSFKYQLDAEFPWVIFI